MPDLVFPPSILKRYKEFIIESAVQINIPSLGAIPGNVVGNSCDSTFLGSVPVGVLQATTYPALAHYINAKYSAGGKSGDGINGFVIGAIRDVNNNPNPITNGIFKGFSLPNFADGTAIGSLDATNLAGILSGTAVTTQDKLTAYSFPTGFTIGHKLAYDAYFVRQGNAVAVVDPGLWILSNFSATYAMLLFGPVPVPPT